LLQVKWFSSEKDADKKKRLTYPFFVCAPKLRLTNLLLLLLPSRRFLLSRRLALRHCRVLWWRQW
jgi:hypothetical protein